MILIFDPCHMSVANVHQGTNYGAVVYAASSNFNGDVGFPDAGGGVVEVNIVNTAAVRTDGLGGIGAGAISVADIHAQAKARVERSYRLPDLVRRGPKIVFRPMVVNGSAEIELAQATREQWQSGRRRTAGQHGHVERSRIRTGLSNGDFVVRQTENTATQRRDTLGLEVGQTLLPAGWRILPRNMRWVDRDAIQPCATYDNEGGC